jgi:hypothetical protein
MAKNLQGIMLGKKYAVQEFKKMLRIQFPTSFEQTLPVLQLACEELFY